MVFSDSTDKQGIVEEVRFLTGTNSSTYPIAQLTRNVNRALDKVTSTIISADGRWQWDDSNETDYPIATSDLVSGQKEYVLSNNFLTIYRVEWKDSNGNWVLGVPIDQRDIKEAIDEFQKTDSTPLYYDKINDSLFLFPKPNYNSTDGLKVYYQRNTTYFTASDTVKEPGFGRQFHRLLSLYAAKDYAVARKQEMVTPFTNEIQKLEDELERFYGARSEDEPRVIKSVYKTSR